MSADHQPIAETGDEYLARMRESRNSQPSEPKATDARVLAGFMPVTAKARIVAWPAVMDCDQGTAPDLARALKLTEQAEAVIRVVAEGDAGDENSKALWGVMTIIGLMVNELKRENADGASCYAEQALGMISLITAASHAVTQGDVVLSAGKDLIQMAREVLP